MGKDDPTLDLQIADVTMANSTDWNQIRKANMIDLTMVRLAMLFKEDGLKQPKNFLMTSKVYFQYRYTLHIVDGIIFLHDRIMVPISLRQVFLQKIHDAHLGVIKSRLL